MSKENLDLNYTRFSLIFLVKEGKMFLFSREKN